MISLPKFVALTKQLGDQYSTTQPGAVQATGMGEPGWIYTDAAIKIAHNHSGTVSLLHTTITAKSKDGR